MAEEKIIYEVIIDTTQLTKQAAETRKAIDDIKAKQKELDTSTAEGRLEFERNAATLRSLQTEYRQATKDIDNIAKAVKSETGSIAANRAELARLTAEYIKIGKPTREQTTQIKKLSDELKKQEKAIGDTRRNVGNYSSALTGLTSAIPGATGGMQAFNAVVSLNPVGLLVLSVTALVAIFKDFEPLVDRLKIGMAILGDVMDAAAQRLSKLGSGFVDIISGDFDKGFKKVKDSVSGLSDELDRAVESGFEYADSVDKINDANKRLEISNAKQEQQIAILRKQLKDRTKEDEDRLAIADKISELEIKRFNEEKNLLEANVFTQRRALEAALERAGITREEIDATQDLLFFAQQRNLAETERTRFADARIALINKQTVSETLLEKTQVDRNRVEDEIAQKQKKRDEDALKRRQKEQEALDKQLAFSIKLAQLREEGLEAEAEKLREQQEQATEDAFEAQLDANQLFFDERQIAIQDDYAKQLISKQEFDAQIKENEQLRLQSELETLEKNGKDTLEVRKKIAEQGVAITQEEADRKAAIRKAELEAEKAFTDSFISLIGALGAAAGQGAQAAKAVALFQIALDSAKAVSNITVTSSSPLDPTNLLTGGALIPIKIATGIATVLANIARAVSIVNSAPGFYDGGYTGDGNPREESRAIGRKPYIYHKAEYVIDHKTLRQPAVAAFVENVIEPIRSRNPRMNLSGYADGGFAVASVQNAVNNSLQTERLIKAFSSAELKVGVTEINNAQNRVKVIDDLNTF